MLQFSEGEINETEDNQEASAFLVSSEISNDENDLDDETVSAKAATERPNFRVPSSKLLSSSSKSKGPILPTNSETPYVESPISSSQDPSSRLHDVDSIAGLEGATGR